MQISNAKMARNKIAFNTANLKYLVLSWLPITSPVHKQRRGSGGTGRDFRCRHLRLGSTTTERFIDNPRPRGRRPAARRSELQPDLISALCLRKVVAKAA